ncbi:MAG: protein kinase [Planctomycetota bacterium]|nr:protein kinase [Planctomycetota bacterium]
MTDDFETRDASELLPVFDSAQDFSLDEVNHLWEEITGGKADPTLTFEREFSQKSQLTKLAVPRRNLARQGQEPARDTSVPKRAETGRSGFSEYEIGNVLGEGGMGIIYEAHQTALNRAVAIKMLKPESDSESQRMKFLSEAVLTGTLQHPNIIALHDIARDQDENLFYSMKKINGQPWSQTIDELSLDENLDIFLRICNAVAFAHSRNVIHRDIKPGNVMLGEFGEVLLMDWGLAVVIPDDRQLQETEYPGLGGTPSYMAPELARGDFGRLGPKSDVYLLGAVLFQIVTGIPPHAGNSVTEVLMNAANNIIESTSKQGELLSIAQQAMSSDPKHRFDSAIELRKRIRNFQIHSQSMGLTRRAKKMAKRARQTKDYSLFAHALLNFEEAIDVWSENLKAINGLVLTKKYYVEAAIENGDLDLAASILEGSEAINANAERQARTLTARVTELKKDRVILQEKQVKAERDLQKWTDAFDASPDLVAISRLRDGLVLEVNEAYLQTLGFTRDEVIGRNAAQLKTWVDPRQRERFVELLERDGRCDEMETWIRTREGQVLPVLLSACQLGFEGETAVITHAHDISNRKQMEKALEESENRLRETQELAKLGTWEYNLETEVIHWSDETFRIVGISRENGEPSLEGFLSTVHPDDAPLLLALINKAREDGSPYRIEVRHRQPDGHFKHVLATGKPKFEGKKVVLLFGSLMDISEFRHP